MKEKLRGFEGELQKLLWTQRGQVLDLDELTQRGGIMHIVLFDLLAYRDADLV